MPIFLNKPRIVSFEWLSNKIFDEGNDCNATVLKSCVKLYNILHATNLPHTSMQELKTCVSNKTQKVSITLSTLEIVTLSSEENPHHMIMIEPIFRTHCYKGLTFAMEITSVFSRIEIEN